ncbi:MAG: site-specific integrase [Campylobacteraceae bacterium]|jgi:integrase|nr:site-specific integrase [Campylobacteraceae bacterium]
MSYIKSSEKYPNVYHKILKNGDYVYSITYREGDKKRWVKIGKKSEGINVSFANQQRIDILNKLKFGNDAPIVKYKQKSDISLAEIVQTYKNSKELTPKTKQQLDFAVSTAIDITGKSRLKEFTDDDINQIKNTLKDNGKAPKTINNFIGKISTLFNFAIDRGDFKEVNPCKKIGKIKHDNTRERYLTTDEVDILKEAIKDKPTLLLFVELSLSTGARLETITSIRKKDISLITQTITLQNHKTNRTYKGFIADSLLPLVQERLKTLKSPNDLLINITSKNIQKQLQPRLNKLFNDGLDVRDAKNRVVIHSLRHTFASHLAIKGIPIFTIMKLLDHKDIKDTLRYAKLAPDNGLEAVKRLWQ